MRDDAQQRPTSDPYAALDTALDMSPLKSPRVRRLHGAYTRALRGLLASAAELELVDDCQDEAHGLRRVATDLAITGMWAIRAAGRLR